MSEYTLSYLAWEPHKDFQAMVMAARVMLGILLHVIMQFVIIPQRILRDYSNCLAGIMYIMVHTIVASEHSTPSLSVILSKHHTYAIIPLSVWNIMAYHNDIILIQNYINDSAITPWHQSYNHLSHSLDFADVGEFSFVFEYWRMCW